MPLIQLETWVSSKDPIREPELRIEGKPARFRTLWAQLKADAQADSVEVTIVVPGDIAGQVFQGVEAVRGIQGAEAVLRDVKEFGSFVVQEYLEQLAAICKEDREPWRWVLAGIESVTWERQAIQIQGRAVPFTRGLLKLLPVS